MYILYLLIDRGRAPVVWPDVPFLKVIFIISGTCMIINFIILIGNHYDFLTML